MGDYQLLSVDALSYELINKRFRNPVLGHVRKHLTEKMGNSLESQIKALYVKEWEAITKSVELAKARGQQREPIDNLDRLSVNHLPVLFDKFFIELVPPDAIPAGDAVKAMRKKFLGWLEEVKDIRNPNAHPPEEDLPVFDALTLADACLRVVRLLQLDDAIQSIKDMQAHLLRRAVGADDDQPGQSSVLSIIPPRETMYDKFVGRTPELEALWAWYAE